MKFTSKSREKSKWYISFHEDAHGERMAQPLLIALYLWTKMIWTRQLEVPTRLFKVQCSMGLIASQLCICKCRGSLGKIRHFALNLNAIENDKCRTVIIRNIGGVGGIWSLPRLLSGGWLSTAWAAAWQPTCLRRSLSRASSKLYTAEPWDLGQRPSSFHHQESETCCHLVGVTTSLWRWMLSKMKVTLSNAFASGKAV